MTTADASITVREAKKLRRWGIFQVALGALVISFSSVFVMLTETGPTVDAVYRMLFGGLGLLLIAIFRGERLWGGYKLGLLMSVCAISVAIDLAYFHRSITFIGPGLATVIGNFQVFFLILIGMFVFRERFKLSFILAAILAMVGLFMLVGLQWGGSNGEAYQTGVYYAFITAVFYAIFILTLRYTRDTPRALPLFANLAMISLFSAALLVVMALFQGESLAIVRPQDYFWLFTYGISNQLVGWLLISRGMPRISVSLAGLLIMVQPGFAFIWDMLFFHRPTTLIDIVGVLLTLAAIYVGSISYQQPAASNAQRA